ncbi:hypothetical protein TSOC_002667 [Tetrabaena socialis]|uniref:CBM20 domain-containing protein n=1 Tax=Tetrabaena socialis TaxID=47790 RepID=A0A2J8ADJ6_9CHLO|nr:hypothetical protein TSOC_002667 [Tetrabaena socialis]|eukprot:PNH10579.1 hypothetical protein TSOC_002667 [Tetrabaena socialis]
MQQQQQQLGSLRGVAARREVKLRRTPRADATNAPTAKEQPPTVRVKFSVGFRAHRWSFLSIAKAPLAWSPGDKWSCEVDLVAGQRIEYKYVVLEEQEWTNLADKFAQGYVEVPYRTAADPGTPPDPREIVAMAIVAWQPGPNRYLQVPTEEELQRLGSAPVQRERNAGTVETLSLDESGTPLLTKEDVWGWP